MPSDRTNALTTWLLLCGAVGGFGFIAVFLAAGAIRPDYDPLVHPISALSLSRGGWVQITNFVVTGLLMLACAAGLRRALSSGRGRTWGPILIGTFGLALIGAGVIVMDPGYGYPPGTPPGIPEETTWHDRVSVIVFASVAAAAFVFARRFATQPHGRRWAAYSLLTGFGVLAFFVAAAAAWMNGGPGGLYHRLSILVGWVWVALLAIHTIKMQRSPIHEPEE